MSIRKAIGGVILLIILIAGAWALSSLQSKQRMEQQRPLGNTVTYACDARRTIVATFIEGAAAPSVQPGQPPVPTGSVMVSIGGEPTTTLARTLSADGARYANGDESLVFWSKGDTALVMRDNSMDTDYTNCTAPAAAAADAPMPGPITVSGTFVCLPHKDTSGPQTDECAFGIKDAQGRYFALMSTDPASIGTLAGGAHITVDGTFAPRSDPKYQDLGVITVTDVSTQ
ncbi:MAG TPA: MliC family protein [Candidatus Paceibacterota bacterium]|nr:MliC family protein [Candidatus Paceibacterota bacterium]